MKSTTLMSGALVAASNIYSTVAALHIGSHAASHIVRANKLQVPSAVPVPNQYKSQGCFGSKGNLTEPAKSVEHVSSGLCNNRCTEEKFWVSALQADKCYCGFAYPPSASLGSDDSCNYPCPGYGNEACGALGQPGFFSVWNTGINVNPPFYQVPTTSDSPTPTPTPTPSDHAPDTTQTVEPSITAEPPKANNPNVAGIAAGTVAGVVLVAGIIGVGFFFIRRKRNAEIEEEHRRNAAVNAFINGSKPPSTSGSISMTDSRLDPVLAHRRMSDGSIADNEDYSRRILRVTNA